MYVSDVVLPVCFTTKKQPNNNRLTRSRWLTNAQPLTSFSATAQEHSRLKIVSFVFKWRCVTFPSLLPTVPHPLLLRLPSSQSPLFSSSLSQSWTSSSHFAASSCFLFLQKLILQKNVSGWTQCPRLSAWLRDFPLLFLPPLPSLSWAHFICIHACLGLHLLFTFIPLFSHIVSAIIPPSLPRRHLDSRQLSAADVLTSVCVFSGHCVVMVTQHTQVCGLPHKRSTKLN